MDQFIRDATNPPQLQPHYWGCIVKRVSESEDMNRAFNHGSQGDFFSGAAIEGEGREKPVALSSAPAGTGQQIRDAAREGNDAALRVLLKKWKSDIVINEVRSDSSPDLQAEFLRETWKHPIHPIPSHPIPPSHLTSLHRETT